MKIPSKSDLHISRIKIYKNRTTMGDVTFLTLISFEIDVIYKIKNRYLFAYFVNTREHMTYFSERLKRDIFNFSAR